MGPQKLYRKDDDGPVANPSQTSLYPFFSRGQISPETHKHSHACATAARMYWQTLATRSQRYADVSSELCLLSDQRQLGVSHDDNRLRIRALSSMSLAIIRCRSKLFVLAGMNNSCSTMYRFRIASTSSLETVCRPTPLLKPLSDFSCSRLKSMTSSRT